MIDVAIIGAGHAGLCVVEALQRRGVTPAVFDPADRLGDVWRRRYDALVLNTRRDASSIPGVVAPASMGQWPGKDEWADHIEHAAAEFGVECIPESVESIRRDGDAWELTTSAGTHRAQVVVVATGRNHEPVIPPWSGSAASPIRVIHAATFKRPEPFVGRRVLVVGSGNSGVEIAHLCTAAGVDTTISIEHRPVFTRREFFGTDLTTAARRAKRLPDRVIDVAGRLLQFALFGRLRRFGLGPPEMRLSNVAEVSGATLDSGFIDDVRAGRISVTDAVDHFDGDHVVTRSGRRLAVDVVIAATGYSPELDGLLPPDALLRGWPRAKQTPWMSAPGLYTAGLNPATLTSFHPDFISEADQIAEDIALLGR